MKRGFTLIETTLSIVIGVILFAGAALIYSQSKTSAGNTQARSKVTQLVQMIEQSVATNNGTYPTIAAVRALWKRRHKVDYLKSPWGGQVGTHLQNPDEDGTRGIADNSTTRAGTPANPASDDPETSHASVFGGNDCDELNDPVNLECQKVPGLNAIPPGSVPLIDSLKAGGLSYSLNDVGARADPSAGGIIANNTETASVFDVTTNVTKIVRGYVVWVYDAQGQYPCFVQGGAPE